MIYILSTLILLVIYYAFIGYFGVDKIPKINISFQQKEKTVAVEPPKPSEPKQVILAPPIIVNPLLKGRTYSIEKEAPKNATAPENEIDDDLNSSEELADKVFGRYAETTEYDDENPLAFLKYIPLAKMENHLAGTKEMNADAIFSELDTFLYNRFEE